MRVDGTGRVHPTLGDEVTAVGLAHLDNCGDCRGDRLPQTGLKPYHTQLRDMVDDLVMNQTAVSPVRGVESFDGAEWQPMIPSVCDICGANVFTVNMGPHKEWHGRMMG